MLDVLNVFLPYEIQSNPNLILQDETHQWHSTQTSGTKDYHDCGIEIRAESSSSSYGLFAAEWRDNDIKARAQTARRRSILFLIAFFASFVACNHLSSLPLSYVTFSSTLAIPLSPLFPLSFSRRDKRRFLFINHQRRRRRW